MTCEPSEDSDQPGHPPGLIRKLCLPEDALGPQLPIECLGWSESPLSAQVILLDLSCSRSYLSHLMTKPTKWHVRPTKTPISLGICLVWSESSLSEWRKLGSIATYWAHSEDSDQTGRMPRLIWFFAGRTIILLVLTWGDSFKEEKAENREYKKSTNAQCNNSP